MTMHNTKYLVKRNASCYNHVKMLGGKNIRISQR